MNDWEREARRTTLVRARVFAGDMARRQLDADIATFQRLDLDTIESVLDLLATAHGLHELEVCVRFDINANILMLIRHAGAVRGHKPRRRKTIEVSGEEAAAMRSEARAGHTHAMIARRHNTSVHTVVYCLKRPANEYDARNARGAVAERVDDAEHERTG